MKKKEIIFEGFKPNFINKKYIFLIIFLTFFSTFLCLFFIENHSLISHDELLYVNRSNLIIKSGDWFTPFPKPHLKLVGSYWLTALSLIFFGQNEFAARLPSYVLSLGTIYIFYQLNKQLINIKIAKLSVLILSSSFLWFNYSHYCSPDLLFIFVNILATYILSKIDSYSNKKVNYKLIFLSAFLFSLGFFVRSYMELFPLICLSPFIVHKLNFSNKKYFVCFFLGIIVGFIPSLINFVLAFLKYGDQSYIRPFALLSKKVLEEESPLEGLLFYPRNIFLFNLPAIVFIFVGVKSIFKFKKKDAKLLFLICPSIALVLLMITASTYTHYLLFIIPWISTLIAFGIFESLSINKPIYKLVLNIFSMFCFLLGLILFFVCIISIFFGVQILDLNTISQSIILIFGIFYIYFSINLFLNSEKENKIFSIIKILVLQILLFSYLFGTGTIGNPNNEIKRFISTNTNENSKPFAISQGIESKRKRLLQFYSRDFIILDLNNLSSNNGLSHLYLLESELNKISKRKTLQYEKVNSYKDLYLIKLNTN